MKTSLHHRPGFFQQLVAVWMCAALLGLPLRGNPVGEQVVAGGASFARDGSTLTVNQSSDRAIINWQDFSIGASELTRFLQPSSTSAALNRVISGNPSSILGTLQANGQVYLINPNGILVGGGARIDCASFIASTLDVADDAFMAGGGLHFMESRESRVTGHESGVGIQNLGSINAGGGDVFLIARTVENKGTISAPDGTVGLVAGQDVYLAQDGEEGVMIQLGTRNAELGTGSAERGTETGIANSGLIQAAQAQLKAQGNIYSVAINNEGIVEATGAVEKNGRVLLVAVGEVPSGGGTEGGAVISSGTLRATTPGVSRDTGLVTRDGGAVHISGGFVGLGGKVDASGVARDASHETGVTGNGGTVTIQAGTLSLAGEITAKGGIENSEFRIQNDVSGKGGTVNIHVTGKTLETSSSLIDVSGANGGTILHLAGQQITSSGTYRALGVAQASLPVTGETQPGESQPGESQAGTPVPPGTGGKIDITAPATKLLSASFDASGAGDGGRIRIGGEFQGGKGLAVDELPNAQLLAVSSGTSIRADGGVARDTSHETGVTGNGGETGVTSQESRVTGNGGTVILWSDQKSAVYADISAKGSGVTRDSSSVNQSPQGGFVEVSSGDTLTFGGTVATSGGTVLFDPKNITIAEPGASQYGLIMGFNYQSIPGFNTALDANDEFGIAVEIDGARMAVGARKDDGLGNSTANAGAVYLFTFADTSFSSPKLEGMIGKGYVGGKNYDVAALEANDHFGIGVALDGNRLAVGADQDAGSGNVAGTSGAVYLFSFADSAFSSPTLEATIGKGYSGGKNYDLTNLESNDRFGEGISLDGNRLAIGALQDDGSGNVAGDSGAVYLFSFSDSAFSSPTLEATIGKGYTGGKNFDMTGLEASDGFGSDVSLDGNRLAAGAYGDDGSGNAAGDSGAVYLFTFTDSAFSGANLEATLGKGYSGGKNLDVSALGGSDIFGRSVSLDGNRLAVGAMWDDGSGNSTAEAGAVYLFTFTDSAFSGATLEATIGKGYTGGKNFNLAALEADDTFGSLGLSLDGNRLAVGAYEDDGSGNSSTDSGAVYLFTFTDSAFSGATLAGTIGKGYVGKNFDLSSQLGANDEFGIAAEIDGSRLAVGARKDDGLGNSTANAGAVYLFTFADTSFSSPKLEGVIGKGYTGGKNYDVAALEANDHFGIGVALDGNRLAVGADQDAGSGNVAGTSGAVYLFSFSDSTFSSPTLEATIGKGYVGGKNYDLTNLEANDRFGEGISLDGNRLAIGALQDAGSGNVAGTSGAVYLFSFSDSAFSSPTLEATIGKGYSGGKNFDMTGLEASDGFGSDVSLDGNRLAAGAYGDDGSGNAAGDSGAVYLFTFTDSAFSGANLEATLGKGYSGGKNLDVSALGGSDIFGRSVSLDGNRLAVGAMWDDGSGNSTAEAGAVYLFTFTDSAFSGATLEATIGKGYTGGKNFNLAALDADDTFGSLGLSLDGNRLAVGAYEDDGSGNSSTDSGAVYLFTFTDSAFSGATLAGTIGKGYVGKNFDLSSQLGANDEFGIRVSLNGQRLVVGTWKDDGAGNSNADSGAVYLFTFADSSFAMPTLQGVIGKGYVGGKNFDVAALEANDGFGQSVSLNGNRLAVGAIFDDGSGNSAANAGGVYLFTFTDSAFSGANLEATIGKNYAGGKNYSPANLEAGDYFGYSVSLDGNRLAVGAGEEDGFGNSTPSAGAVYLFSFSDSSFSSPTLEAILGKGYSGGKNYDVTNLENFGGFGDIFGVSVSLDGNRLAVGAHGDDDASNGSSAAGAVYLFTFTDTAFNGANLEGIIGKGYAGGKNYNMTGLEGGGPNGDLFGSDVSLSGNRLAVGAIYDDGAGNIAADSGAVYLFSFSDSAFSNPTLEATIGKGYSGGKNFDMTALEANDGFGFGVALDGTRLAAGAVFDDGSGNSAANSGCVYLFQWGDNSSAATFATDASASYTLSPRQLAGLLSTPQNVILQANNDITVAEAITVNNPAGNGGNLTLQAGRSILVNANITTDNGNLTLTANETTANGVVDAQRDAGNAVITMAGGMTINAGSGNVNITLANGAGKTFTASGDVTLEGLTAANVSVVNQGPTAGSDVVLGASTISGTLDVTTALGNITDSGAISVAGNSTFTANGAGASILLDNANTFTGTVDFAGAGGLANVTIVDSNALDLGAMTLTGNLSVTAGGAITDSGAWAITGTTSLTAGAANNITLDNANDFGGAVTVVSGNNVILNDNDAMDLAASTVSGTLTITVAGAISDSGALTITGATSLTAGAANNIVLDAANNFAAAVSVVSGNNVTLNDTNAIDLGASTVSGTLTITAAGAITDSGALAVTGATSLTAGAANNITLDNASNDFNSVGINSGNNVLLVDSSTIDLGASTVSGTLNVTSVGAISQTGALIVVGAATFDSAGTDIVLSNAGNDFSTAAFTSANAVTVTDLNAMILGATGMSGALAVTAGGNVTQSGALSVSGATTMNAGANDITLNFAANNLVGTAILNGGNVLLMASGPLDLGASTMTGTLDVTSGGAISQSGALAVTGIAHVDAGAGNDITLGLGNNFSILEIASGRDVTVNDISAIDLRNSTVSGTFDLTAAGPITQSGSVTVGGTTTLTAGAANNITLDNAGNNFGTVAITSGNNVTLVDAGAIDLGASTVSGTLNVTAGGNITDSDTLAVASDATFDAGANDITLDEALSTFGTLYLTGGNVAVTENAATDFGGATISGTLAVTSAGNITQAGAMTVTGATTLDAGANDITLGAGNDFGTVAISSGNNVTVNDTGAIDLGASTVGAALNVTVGGNITQSGALNVTGGASTFTVNTAVNADVLLGTQANDFGAQTVTIQEGSGTLRDVSLRNTSASAAYPTLTMAGDLRNLTLIFNNTAITLPTTTLTGNLSVTAGGNITDAGAVTVAGTTTLAAGAANDITLDTAVNDFVGAVAITTGNNVTLVDGGAIDLGASTVSGTLDVTANGAITQSGALNVTGTARFSTAGAFDITLNNAGNDFSTLEIDPPNDATIRDANAIDLGATMVNGTLDITAGGAITQSGALSVGTLVLNAGGAITLDNTGNLVGTLGSVTRGGRFELFDGDDGLMVAGSVNTGVLGNAVLIQTEGGDLTLNAGVVVAATGDGNDVTLVADQDFINESGAGAITTSGTGRYLVYSTDPSSNTDGDLAFDFEEYLVAYPGAPQPEHTGNGFLYSIAVPVVPVEEVPEAPPVDFLTPPVLPPEAPPIFLEPPSDQPVFETPSDIGTTPPTTEPSPSEPDQGGGNRSGGGDDTNPGGGGNEEGTANPGQGDEKSGGADKGKGEGKGDEKGKGDGKKDEKGEDKDKDKDKEGDKKEEKKGGDKKDDQVKPAAGGGVGASDPAKDDKVLSAGAVASLGASGNVGAPSQVPPVLALAVSFEAQQELQGALEGVTW